MPRVKGGVRTRRIHNKVKKLAKGYRGARHRLFRKASEAVIRAGEHAFAGRRKRRRDLRRLWIVRLSSTLTNYDMNYSQFIKGLKNANIDMNRNVLSELAISDPKAFAQVVEKAKESFK